MGNICLAQYKRWPTQVAYQSGTQSGPESGSQCGLLLKLEIWKKKWKKKKKNEIWAQYRLTPHTIIWYFTVMITAIDIDSACNADSLLIYRSHRNLFLDKAPAASIENFVFEYVYV